MATQEGLSGPPDAPHPAEPARVICPGQLREYRTKKGETVRARFPCGLETLAQPDDAPPYLCEYCRGEVPDPRTVKEVAVPQAAPPVFSDPGEAEAEHRKRLIRMAEKQRRTRRSYDPGEEE